jgi:CSLREA domain-containing protein
MCRPSLGDPPIRPVAVPRLLLAVPPLLALAGAGGAPTLMPEAAHRPHRLQQTEFRVNSTADATDASPGDNRCEDATGACTLRAAVREANAWAGSFTIRLPSGTYRLTVAGAGERSSDTGDLNLLSDTTLIGEAGRDATVVRSDVGDRVLHIGPQVTATVDGITIEGRHTVDQGGGISNEGHLTLRDSAVIGNGAGRTGGGIYNGADHLEVSRTIVEGNRAGDSGGGIDSAVGPVQLVDSKVKGNIAANEAAASTSPDHVGWSMPS